MSTHQKIQDSIKNLNNFITSTKNIEAALPNMEEKIEPVDYITIYPAATKSVLDKEVENVISGMKNNDGLAPKLVSALTTLDERKTLLGQLSPFIQTFKQKPMIFVAVNAFNTSTDIFEDATFLAFADMVDNIGAIIATEFELAGLEPVGIAIDAALAIFKAITLIVDIVEKTNKLKDLVTHCNTAFSAIAKGLVDTQASQKDLDQVFAKMKNTLTALGKKESSDPHSIAADFLDLQTKFKLIYEQYETPSVKNSLPDPRKTAPTIALFDKMPGYGSISMGSFIAILYAEDSIADKDLSAFLQEYVKEHPPGGINKLVAAISFARKSRFK